MRYLKRPATQMAERDPAVTEKVSEMLLKIERGGIDAIRAYSRDLDAWDPPSFVVSDDEIARATEQLDDELKEAVAFARDQIAAFASAQRAALHDFELETIPGAVLGQRQVPVGTVGAYVPGGRLPMAATPLMTIVVPKVAGVETVVACAPPYRGGPVYPSVLHAMAVAGADAIFAIGGVQAIAAMAFGIEGMGPVDVVVGPGNAYVAEAKRQLYGRVGIDLPAGPTEILVVCDGAADAELVAADLIGQAEHGPTSRSILITTSEEVGREVLAQIDTQLAELPDVSRDTATRAWNGFGIVALAEDDEQAALLADEHAAEHVEIHTADPDWYLRRLRNYGSLFLGERTTVAYSDKAIGTNHVLPTDRAARYTAGLSVASFLKPLTYQRVESDAAAALVGRHAAAIARADLMPAHEASIARRLARLPDRAAAAR